MPDLLTITATFLIGVAASFMGVVAGGASLITVPFLIFIGLPPQVAIATNKFGGMGISLGASYKLLWKTKNILWEYVVGFCLLSALGAYLGANMVLAIDPALLTKLVGAATLVMIPLLLIKNDRGTVRVQTSKPHKVIGHILYFLAMILAGSFGSGGILLTYIFLFLFGFTMLQTMATITPPFLLLSITSTVVFALNGIIDFAVGIALFAGMIVGGHLGAHTAVKKGDAWLKTVFTIMVAISGIKLLFS